MKIYRMSELASRPGRPGLVGLSASAIFDAVKNGTFPKSNVVLGKRARGWSADVIESWAASRRTDRP